MIGKGETPSRSGSFYLMDTFVRIAKISNLSILDMMNEDVDTVILLLNYYLEASKETPAKAKHERKAKVGGVTDEIWNYI